MNSAPQVPAIAVVVCTYNRAPLLRRALDSLAAQTVPANRREIILVDDGSTDDTREVAVQFAARSPEFTAIHQPNAGLGAARNTGWRSARAPLIAFLDDDAIAPPDWLQEICDIFTTADARLAVLGGPIDPDWESPPPAWLTRDLKRWLTVFDLGPVPLSCSDRPIFGGANMAFRVTALREVDGFPEDLGRRRTSLLSHEESAVWSALAARGWSNSYLPHLRVQHFIPSARMTVAWFRRRLFWEGVSIARREQWPEAMTRTRRLRRWFGIGVARFGTSEFLGPLLRPWRWGRDVRWQTYCAYYFGYMCEIFRRLAEQTKAVTP